MKAVLFDQPGEADVLYVGEHPAPQPGTDELLVRAHATALNRADLLQRRGGYPPPPGASSIVGLELAGEVVEGAGRWQPGDRVMALVTGGGYAELAAVPLQTAMPIPANLSFEEAACIPEAFLTAYLNLFMLGRLQAGEAVLIHAGASGVGTAAIQLARAAGARVFTTAGSDEKRQRCEALGADMAIDYHSLDFAQRVLEATDGRGVDVVLDFVGASYWNQNMTALARGGRLMLIGFLGGSRGELDLGPVMRKHLTITGTTLRPMPLPQKAALVEAFSEFTLHRFETGELIPVLDSVYPLEQAAAAHRAMEANANFGKIVLQI
ncbi:MAG: NAD(P)H-quinone oxidoreductase [bacterium]|nr:NAD(P)H-quinone oxidoreductase [bacterium]